MSVSVSKEATECYGRAKECADLALIQSDPKRRREYLEMQRRWLSLARSYEFAEQLEFLSNTEAKNNEARQIIVEAAA
jgi:hypothetical protein